MYHLTFKFANLDTFTFQADITMQLEDFDKKGNIYPGVSLALAAEESSALIRETQ